MLMLPSPLGFFGSPRKHAQQPRSQPTRRFFLGMLLFLAGNVGLLQGLLGLHMRSLDAEESPQSAASAAAEAKTNSPEKAASPEVRPSTDPQSLPTLLVLERPPTQATLLSASEEKLVFRIPAGETLSLPTDQLIRWGAPQELQRGPVVVLADGTLLVAQTPHMSAMTLTVEPDLLTPKRPEGCRLPIGHVVGVVFRLPLELAERDRLLDRLHQQPPEEDRIGLLNGDELTGRVETIEEKTLRVKGPLGPMAVEVSRIRAVHFRRLPRPSASSEGLRIWVGLRDGSLLQAEKILIQDASVQLTLPGSLVFQADLHDVVFLQPVGGRVVYLSDLEPQQYRFEPFFELAWAYMRDRCVTGSWLRSGGRRYLKGLGVHSKATLKYDLAGRYTGLESELGLDDTTGGRGSVVFRILADGKTIYQSQPICGGRPPQPIRLNISGARELEFVVDYGPRGDEMDRANWLDARLIPAAAAPSSPATSP